MTDPVALLEEAGNKLLAAMEMQEGRELETLHISQPTAKHLWDAAKAEWAAAIALMRAPVGDGNVLDQKAETVAGRLWLVSNQDGTREIVGENERAGRGGFAPGFGQTYRQILADMVRSLQGDTKVWLDIYAAYVAGKTPTEGPLGGRSMPAVCFVSCGHVYTAYIGTHHKGNFLGFGGRVAKITMKDGTEYESNNVWSARDVPPNLRGILADNATIKWGN